VLYLTWHVSEISGSSGLSEEMVFVESKMNDASKFFHGCFLLMFCSLKMASIIPHLIPLGRPPESPKTRSIVGEITIRVSR
jgi:hypothetical protein